MAYNVGSLFAGVGGICLGFKRANESFKLTVANEIDDQAIITYKTNFNHLLVEGDIEKILHPELLYQEMDFLNERYSVLSDKVNNNDIEKEEKFIKAEVKKLKESYLNKYSNGGEFVLAEKTEEKFIKEKKPQNEIEKLRNLVEYKIVKEFIEERNNLWIETEEKSLKEKRKKMLEQNIDVLTAGFPCQAFSIAGQRKGFSDHRGELFYSVIEWVKLLEENGKGKPRILFLENVKNLVSHDEGKTFEVITSEIKKLGYKIKYKVLNTFEYTSLPQNRERIFVICFLNEEDYINFGSFDDLRKIKKSKEDLVNALKHYLDYNLTKEDGEEFYYTKEKYPLYYNDDINLDRDINEMYEIYQLRRGMYVRKNQTGVCPTLTANMGTGGHNIPLIKVTDGIRKLTPKDCFNLQGFRVGNGYTLPNIKKASLYKQAGNAVSVDVIELIAKKIFKALEKTDSKKDIYEVVDETNINPKVVENNENDYYLKKLKDLTKHLVNREFNNIEKQELKSVIFDILNIL